MATKDISDKQVVEAYIACDIKPRRFFPYQVLEELTGQCEKVCFRAMERSQDRGFIECGVSLRTGWVTDSGKLLLK